MVGLLRSPSGLGEGARLILAGLESAGLEPAYLDITPHLDGHTCNIDLLPSRPDDGVGPILLHINPHELLHLIQIGALPSLHDRYRVGIWAWEQAILPRSWRAITPWVDELWGSSSFLVNLFKRYTNLPVRHMPYPCALLNPDAIVTDQTQYKNFRVLTAFSSMSSMERKNPLGAVDAFLAAFPDDPDAFLTVHSSTTLNEAERALLQRNSQIILSDKTLSVSAMSELLRSHDAFLSLHRAEGFGLSIAKALSMGIPAIFTQHSGAADFAVSPFAFGVKNKPVSVLPSDPHYRRKYGRWAEPNHDDGVAALRTIRTLPPVQRKALAQQAVTWWQERYGTDAFVQGLNSSPISHRLKWSSENSAPK